MKTIWKFDFSNHNYYNSSHKGVCDKNILSELGSVDGTAKNLRIGQNYKLCLINTDETSSARIFFVGDIRFVEW